MGRIAGDALKPRPGSGLEGNEASKYDGPDIGWAGNKKKRQQEMKWSS